MAHHKGITVTAERGGFWKSRPGYKPMILFPAAILFIVLVIMPPPQSMLDLVSFEKPSGYSLPSDCKTITDSVNKKLSPEAFKAAQKGENLSNSHGHKLMSNEDAAQLAKVMLLVFCLVVLFWGTEALPLGATDLLVAVMLYLFSILPMAALSSVHVWKLGLACAFSSSFANFLVVGTPNNAIAFGMGKDPVTGERLLDIMDFVKYGLPITLLAWLVLWFWTIFGYWQFLSWPVMN